jgi:Cu-processing system permease protein
MTAASTIRSVIAYQTRDLIRSRWLVAYTLFFAITGEGLLRYGGGESKALLSLGSIVLFVVPLVTAVFGTVYVYNSRDYTELLLAQPVRRGRLYAGLYLGFTLPLCAAVIAGVAAPLLWHRDLVEARHVGAVVSLLGTAVAMTVVFGALAFLVATCVEDRLKALGTAVAIWLLASLLYDGVVLVATVVLGDHAVERPLLLLTVANPIDLARVLLVLHSDTAALMGYTGAVFTRFFGTTAGSAAAIAALSLWAALPIAFGLRAFARKDF